MEKDKMIEEMAMLLCKDICFRKICAVTNHCQIKNLKMREKATLLYYFIVKKYNDFLPEGAVVLTKEELAKHDENIRKEKAREILSTIASDFYSIGDGVYELTNHDIQELCKKNGVEVEE